jgi:hypothetical protein
MLSQTAKAKILPETLSPLLSPPFEMNLSLNDVRS